MAASNIFELRKKGHLILMITALMYIILSFAPSLDRYFFVFQLILFAQCLTLIAQAIAGFVRLYEPRELLRGFLAVFIAAASLCVGGISNTVLINKVPAWLYIYYFAGYTPAFIVIGLMSRVYSYPKTVKISVNILSALGIICCFGYFFLTAKYNKYIDYSFPFFGSSPWLLNIASSEIIFQICVMALAAPLFRSRDKNASADY